MKKNDKLRLPVMSESELQKIASIIHKQVIKDFGADKVAGLTPVCTIVDGGTAFEVKWIPTVQ